MRITTTVVQIQTRLAANVTQALDTVHDTLTYEFPHGVPIGVPYGAIEHFFDPRFMAL